MDEYTEPVKNKVRNLVLSHAVRALTTARYSSALLSEHQALQMLEYTYGLLELGGIKSFRSTMTSVTEYWLEFRASRISKKKASELQVLILCGPNPVNDVLELVKLDISPYNIWAVESDSNSFESAITKFKEADYPCKIHKGSLHDFFAVVPQQFDIVYFDACAPILEGHPSTALVLKELFTHQRLAPLSVLITNFCGATMDKSKHGMWTDRLSSWFAPRFEQPVDTMLDFSIHFSEHNEGRDSGFYRNHVAANLSEYYSEFVTGFISQFANTLCPWWRVYALKDVKQRLFKPKSLIEKSVKSSLNAPKYDPDRPEPPNYGMAYVAAELFPLLHVGRLVKKLADGDNLRKLFTEDMLRGVRLNEAIEAMSLVRNFTDCLPESIEMCNKEFADALTEFRWFDSTGNSWDRLFCDIPYPNLIADLFIGQVGYPYHLNSNKHRRFSYQARTAEMFTDVFIFDQARYLYDMVPDIALLPGELPDSTQLFMRICMDAIRKHANTIADPFSACSLAGFYGKGIKRSYWLEKRRRIQ